MSLVHIVDALYFQTCLTLFLEKVFQNWYLPPSLTMKLTALLMFTPRPTKVLRQMAPANLQVVSVRLQNSILGKKRLPQLSISVSFFSVYDNLSLITANDTAVLTVFVVDENDEPPQFEILDINNTFFEGILFDTSWENVAIFSLSDRVSVQMNVHADTWDMLTLDSPNTVENRQTHLDIQELRIAPG